MSPESNGGIVPECDSECGELVRQLLRENNLDAVVTHVPPLVPSPYMSLDMRCPHGIMWYTEPTSEQIAEFAAAEAEEEADGF